MYKYISNTDAEQAEMLKTIGVDSMEALFSDIPSNVRLNREMELPKALSDPELMEHMREMASRNADVDEYACFLGAGAYDHYIPSAVGQLLLRQEFYTAYTPYQPEISQGTLQAIFEYQTMICELTGMDVSNASMYDGASALAEAASMACQSLRRNEIIAANTIHPEYRTVLKTYSRCKDIKVIESGYSDGKVDLEDVEAKVSANTAAIIVQSPNFFGIIEDLKTLADIAHRSKALLIACVDPISLAILKSPGELGADIVIGEGQSLGNPLSFGGPYLGFFATTKSLMRKMPGRIVGETVDSRGQRGFVLTLQAREQHIRREKATSNICSNQALNALAATMYLTFMGKKGLREVAELSLKKAHYAYDRLIGTGKFKPCFKAPFFKEFAVKSHTPIEILNKRLLDEKIIGGYHLGRDYPELADGWLVAVTEKRTREQIDNLVRKAGEE